MRVQAFCIPAVAAAMLLALAGCTDDTSTDHPSADAGAAAVAPTGGSGGGPATGAVARPATFPPEIASGTTQGLGDAMTARSEALR